MVSITFMVNFYYIYGWYNIYGFIKFMGDTRAAGYQFVYHEYIITDRIGRHEEKGKNGQERKKWPSYEEKRNLHKTTDKGDENILRPPAPRTGNKSSKAEEQARARNYNFEVLNVID